jgi:hypothetical protein
MKYRRLDVKLRLLGLRVARVLRRHYVTLVSFVVIGALSYAAFTSDQFQAAQRSSSRYSPSDGAAAVGDGGLDQVQSIAWTPPATELTLRAIQYYIIESEEQRAAMQSALVSLNRGRFNAGPVDSEEWVYFVQATTAQEDAQVAAIIARAEVEARTLGYSFQVTDLRQAAKN